MLAAPQDIHLEMMSKCLINSHGIPKTLVTRYRSLSLGGQTPGVFTICRALSGSGVATGTLKIFLVEWIQKVQLKVLIEFIVEDVAISLLITVDPPTETVPILPYVL